MVLSKVPLTGGHLEVLQWAHQNECPWNEYTCSHAAKGGHLEVLQWARQNGCPWDEGTCAYAAEGGHLEVLKWARQNGCPWIYATWISASSRCRAYLIEHGCPGARRRATPRGGCSSRGVILCTTIKLLDHHKTTSLSTKSTYSETGTYSSASPPRNTIISPRVASQMMR